MDEWSLIKSDDHDMAEAILLTEEIMNAVMDMVRVMVRITERSESSLYWTNHVSDVRPRPIEKPCSRQYATQAFIQNQVCQEPLKLTQGPRPAHSTLPQGNY